MKSVRFILAAAVVLAAQSAPAFAFSTASPYIRLIPLNAKHVAVSGAPSRCNAPAAVAGDPYFELPAIAAEQGVSGTAQVKVDLTSTGKLASEALYETSGNRWLDDAALRSARLTAFTSEIIDCEHVAGSYLYEVDF